MKWVALALVLSCSRPDVIAPSAEQRLPGHREIVLDPSPKARRRELPAEAILRAYLLWFGTTSPDEVFRKAHGDDLFDRWPHYLAALGLPDYHVDAPRIAQSNTVMIATLGRLGEALCIRSAEHELHARLAVEQRHIFAFDAVESLDRVAFVPRFDVLHRTFLGYPVEHAPPERVDRYLELHRRVAARHPSGTLTASEMGWAAVCTALVQHPEAGLY